MYLYEGQGNLSYVQGNFLDSRRVSKHRGANKCPAERAEKGPVFSIKSIDGPLHTHGRSQPRGGDTVSEACSFRAKAQHMSPALSEQRNPRLEPRRRIGTCLAEVTRAEYGICKTRPSCAGTLASGTRPKVGTSAVHRKSSTRVPSCWPHHRVVAMVMATTRGWL